MMQGRPRIAGWQFRHCLYWNLTLDLRAQGYGIFPARHHEHQVAHSSGWYGIWSEREATAILPGRLLPVNTFFVAYCCECSTAATSLSCKVFMPPPLVLCCWCQSVCHVQKQMPWLIHWIHQWEIVSRRTVWASGTQVKILSRTDLQRFA